MPRKNTGASQRDLFGNAHGTNGKGSRDRTTDRTRYSQRFPEGLTGDVKGFGYVGGGKFRKVYGGRM